MIFIQNVKSYYGLPVSNIIHDGFIIQELILMTQSDTIFIRQSDILVYLMN